MKELGFWIILDICKDGKEKYGNNEKIIKFLKEACDKLDETLENIEILNAKEDKKDVDEIDTFFSKNAKKSTWRHNFNLGMPNLSIPNISNPLKTLTKKKEESESEPLLGH